MITTQALPSDFSALEQILEQEPQASSELTPSITHRGELTNDENIPYTEAYISAAYEHNPKPNYPSIARSHGWQGKVTLRVQVNQEGKVELVAVEQSCGHESLDESAVEAVKQWYFVPAKRGETRVASLVLVPIIFSLQDQESYL
ncbi:energy transducer TonB [Methylomonas albis]|nr:energy transducer TonB [Methylomonas albis]